jgi:hypothetical protein
MNPDPAEKEIRNLNLQQITQIKKNIHLFKQSLSNISALPRELLIRKIYLTQVNDFFTSISFGNYEIKHDSLLGKVEESKKFDIDTEIESVIKLIQLNSAKKTIYIKKFLENFTSISEQDRSVMINTLLDLSEAQLRQELKQLTEFFPIL